MAIMDKDTFGQRIREYMPNMYRISYGILNNRADAEDAVSETILLAYRNLHTLRRAENFRPWLMQITVNEARRLYAYNKRHAPMEDMEPCLPAFQDEYHELWDVVMELELVYRETILLYFYERFTIPEIARTLHIPQGTVKSRLSRAKKLLREKLSDH